jgi:hypothetical protein
LKAKIEKENEIKKKYNHLNELTKYYDQLVEVDNQLTDKFEKILRQFKQFQQQRLLESANLEVLYKLKQGQVEVEQVKI